MSKLLERAASQTDRRAADNMAAGEQARIGAAAERKARTEGAAETAAAIESDRTGKPVTWQRRNRRADGTSYPVTMRIDAGAYRPADILALCREAAALAARRFKRADLADLAADLAEVALRQGPAIGRLPGRGDLGGDESIADPRERDRAYLVGVARHRLADQARDAAAETESLDQALAATGEGLSLSGLVDVAESQARSDTGLIDPDAAPVNRDSWGLSLHFPTRDSGRAALADLIGTRATRADLARQAGLREPKDWHRAVKRGRPALAALRAPVTAWTDRDWRTAESLAALTAAETADRRPSLADLLARPGESTYRPPKGDRPWRTQPDSEAPTASRTEYRPNRASRVLAWIDLAPTLARAD